MYTLGIDLGSSSVKASVLDVESGRCMGAAHYPPSEMHIDSPRPGWAEQDPQHWWQYVIQAIQRALSSAGLKGADIAALGIAYQMHGLVLTDGRGRPVRPSIIWCDSRAAAMQPAIIEKTGRERLLQHLHNLPGNFTFSKLAWVQAHEARTLKQAYKCMLPGDYIAMKLTGKYTTTPAGLSEGIMYDYTQNQPATWLFEAMDIPTGLLPEMLPVFGDSLRLSPDGAAEAGLKAGIPVSYRAGDQPNNAFSLGLLRAGEVAATAGTSGVVYAVSDQLVPDSLSRTNSFAHVNHQPSDARHGILLCINGCGIANAWIKKMAQATDYQTMNQLAASVAAGSDGLVFLPFGNGSERMLGGQQPGGSFHHLDFSRHHQPQLYRAVQEGIACAFRYGIDIMAENGLKLQHMRAGQANLFQSPVFAQSLANLSQVSIQLFNTDGSLGAARGAALGAGLYASEQDCFASLTQLAEYTPDKNQHQAAEALYERWLQALAG